MKLRFVFRPSESLDPAAPGAILCYVTLDKVRRKFTSPVTCYRKQWDAKAQRLTGSGQQARLHNAALADIEASINRLYYDMERAGTYITCERLLTAYRGGGGRKATLLDAWQQFVDSRRPLTGRGDFGPAKLEADERRGRILATFLEAQQLTGLLPSEFTPKLADQYLAWLRVQRGVGQNYAAKVLQTTVQVLRWCVRHELTDRYPLDGYRLRYAPPAAPLFLTPEDLQRLHQHQFPAAALRTAADCFLFQCYTGLAYADLLRFRRSEHTRIGAGGQPQLYMVRQKTEGTSALPALVPLLPPALALLDRYGEQFPVPTNQVYNRFLKEVAAVCNLSVTALTSHVGRKTCGAVLLRAGVSMEAVSRALGHRTVAMTQRHYVSITDSIVEQEFRRVFGKGTAGEEGPADKAA